MINRIKLLTIISISILINQSQATTTSYQSTTPPDVPICSNIRGPYAIDLVQCTRAINNIKASGDPDEPNQTISFPDQTYKISCGNCGITLKAETDQEIKTTTDGAQEALRQIFQNCTGGYGQMKIPIQSTNLQFEDNVDLIIDATNSERC
ncbi:uncharacterized protein MELLADRAFT_108691 [Melampsora larici-populina 98AG31]|uniref:Secreted protein n=1 Tax=Melampsora larici-populina (strain 98AG31 / pathotype 3-4-7) TaxID=747676 RepID=F4RTX4_MELLP|nr:uncharacterized protein MELLADRAFT_108691 [Melampsora larici-populina 98AG31]EGG04186.1 secreted protein [Melampsora larici-populina 98AG31]